MNLRTVGLALVGVVSLVGMAGCGVDAGDPVARADAPSAAATVVSEVQARPVESTVAPTTEVPEIEVPETQVPSTEVTTTEVTTTEVTTTEVTTAEVTTAEVTTAEVTAGIVEVSPYLSAFCPTTPHAVAVDRDRQRAWLCEEGRAVYEFPFTGAITQPDAGTYPVYAKDLNAFSTLSGPTSFMTHFVAFTYGKYQGARIAFHSVPTYRDGTSVQAWESVGDLSMRGQSAGCLRVLPDDAVKVWDWLAEGDEVRVIN